MEEKKRGRDLLPTDMIRFRHVERVFREQAIRWGYQEVRTPTIEPLSLFTRAGTLDPRMLDNLYSFLDWDGWSGERVVLRPDGTIPVSRLFIEHFDKASPIRLMYIANMFSHDDDGTSEHWQCGVELIETTADEKSASDADVVALALQVVNELGFSSPYLRVGYPPLIRKFLEISGLKKGEREEITALIHERNIEGLERVAKQYQKEKGLDKLMGLLGFKSTSPDFIKNVSSYLPEDKALEKELKDFSDSINVLAAADLPFEINFGMPVNFEYYTGLVVEVYPEKGKTKKGDLLITGGRYDNLVGLLSGKTRDAAAVGFALKVENVIGASEFVKELSGKAVLIRPDGDLGYARALVSGLRDSGYIAEIFGVGQNKADFRWSVGFDEDTVTVTDRDDGEPKKIEREKVKNGKQLAKIISG